MAVPKLDLAIIAPVLARFDKDERRIGLFVAACQAKTLEFAAAGDLAAIEKFGKATAAHLAGWGEVARKFQFPRDLFRDRFKEQRELTRAFAANWDLDPIFRSEMG